MSSPASGPFDAAIAHPEEPLGMITEPDGQELERAYSLLWTPVHEKAHVVLPTSDALETLKEHLLQNIDEHTARLVPEPYRTTLYFFFASIHDEARQDWFRESPLPEVTINRHIPLPKMVETHPLRQAAQKLEKFAFKLKEKNPADAVELKHLSDSINLICDVLYHEEIKAKTQTEGMAVQMDKTLQKLQLLDGPALTAIIDEVNEEQQKQFAEVRKLAVDAHNEDGASALQMTDKEWLLCYRNMGDAEIQKWVDFFVDISDIETGLPDTWKALVMQTGGDRLWRVLNNAMSNLS
ncbi:uncharacterized protein NECHADRAFT_75178 [Fusarium vanettenii 77-13-4]|uniref:Uncharacterized protein n=1 Tax=Fusarium vanettenii (strain ATCC MYA-4622 / CBS 123669 / FGSC 9596 / NRRL 45880 / 77-13-4) TaxID=660122 RepID=C7YI31_FUSV7|nr:uncharacterized protein NECHADRAFT_75178 [Fusarium vanettenii 77-13-4]EEU48022.1 predicted protein [Fusarium vanettenii 77-13-4]